MESNGFAKCKLCQKTFEIDNVGVSTAISHGQGNIHKSRDNTVSLYSTLTFKAKTAVSTS